MTTTQPFAPASSPGAPPPRGAAITALVLGIVAFLSGAVPVLGALIGIVGVVFAIVAMRRAQSRGMSITGLILSILAILTSVVMTIVLAITAGAFFSTTIEPTAAPAQHDAPHGVGTAEQETEPPGESAAHSGGVGALDPSTPIRWDELHTADAPASTYAGTPEQPHTLGSRFTIAQG